MKQTREDIEVYKRILERCKVFALEDMKKQGIDFADGTVFISNLNIDELAIWFEYSWQSSVYKTNKINCYDYEICIPLDYFIED